MSDSHAFLKLHIGGRIPKAGWKILNIQPGPAVDFVGDCMDLSQFRSGSISEIYLSHVLEHLDYQKQVHTALEEFKRVLVPGGKLMIGVPDLDVLCHIFLAPFFNYEAKYFVMRMMFGGQVDPHDYHKAGYNFVFLHSFLVQHGFERIRRVPSFGLFEDTTEKVFNGIPISLNVEAHKPGSTS